MMRSLTGQPGQCFALQRVWLPCFVLLFALLLGYTSRSRHQQTQCDAGHASMPSRLAVLSCRLPACTTVAITLLALDQLCCPLQAARLHASIGMRRNYKLYLSQHVNKSDDMRLFVFKAFSIGHADLDDPGKEMFLGQVYVDHRLVGLGLDKEPKSAHAAAAYAAMQHLGIPLEEYLPNGVPT